jgi:hypothetical protein
VETKNTYRVSESGLIANKELFRIWFEFYKLALVSDDKQVRLALRKSKAFYSDWGTDSEVHFDDWWSTHNHLFVDEGIVRLINSAADMDNDHLYLAVPKTRSLNVAVNEIRVLLDKEFQASRSKRAHMPMHRFAPTEIQGFKRDTMRLHLDLMKNVFNDPALKGKALYERTRKYLESERYKKRKNSLSVFAGLVNDDEDAKRNVRRYKMRCNRLLLNVASGVFPGKY